MKSLIKWTRELLLGKEPKERRQVIIENLGFPCRWAVLDAGTHEALAIELDSVEDAEQYCALVKFEVTEIICK